MRYAQFSAGNKLHLVCEPGEEYRGTVIRIGELSWPLCGLRVKPNYRMTVNMPLSHACRRCLAVLERSA
jgi:hypothetical protein